MTRRQKQAHLARRREAKRPARFWATLFAKFVVAAIAAIIARLAIGDLADKPQPVLVTLIWALVFAAALIGLDLLLAKWRKK